MEMVNQLGWWRLLVGGVIIWVARLAGTIPFLDENGRLPVNAPDGRLPESVEYFFSILVLTLTLSTLVSCYWVMPRAKENWATVGVVTGVGFLGGVLILDLLIAVGVAGRSLSNYFVNVFIDLSPVILIPIFVGLILAAIKK